MMNRIDQILPLALQHHQAGNLHLAEPIYRQILEVVPDHADSLHLLGLIFSQRGQYEAAIEHISRAITNDGKQAGYYINLGNAQSALGKLDDAVASFRRAVAIQPNLAEAHCSLGNALKHQGKLHEAVTCYCLALELKPELAVAHSNLGAVLRALGQLDNAIGCYERAVELLPELPEAHHNLGNALMELGRLDDAIASYWEALQLKPDCPEICNNLGHALLQKGNLEEATAYFGRAVQFKPGYAEAHSNLGAAYRQQAKLDEAVASYGRALELAPQFVEAHSNLGNALHLQGRLDEAAASFQRALALKPDHADAHYSQSFVMLQRGDFERGWAEHEWRWQTRSNPPRGFSQPEWDGKPLPPGTTLLVYAEQGLGDTIQFVRYMQLIGERSPATKMVLECDQPLAAILSSLYGVGQVIVRGEVLPRFDAHVSIQSLPLLFGTRMETIPRQVPYLFANPSLVEQWRESLAEIPGTRIGINWRGSSDHPLRRRRDLPLDLFSKLGEVPGLHLISLQKGASLAELGAAGETPIAHLGEDFDTTRGAFMDTAAVMMNLDLVITSDTSIAHLAGALGVRVWVALPYPADWRWFLDRSDSPWYPTMRLFRQKAAGEWGTVFEEMKAALAEHG
jgi:tetratricopeptide (TPR) repeat protein